MRMCEYMHACMWLCWMSSLVVFFLIWDILSLNPELTDLARLADPRANLGGPLCSNLHPGVNTDCCVLLFP